MSDKIEWKHIDRASSSAMLHYDIAVDGNPLPFGVSVWLRPNKVVELQAFTDSKTFIASGMDRFDMYHRYEADIPHTTTDADILRIARMMACQLAAVFGEVLELQKAAEDATTTTQETTR